MTVTDVSRPAPSHAAPRVEYLELGLLWADTGPVAQVRLRNEKALTASERVQVFVDDPHRRGPIGYAVVRIPPGRTVDARIRLDRDLPGASSWLQRAEALETLEIRAGAGEQDIRLRVSVWQRDRGVGARSVAAGTVEGAPSHD